MYDDSEAVGQAIGGCIVIVIKLSFWVLVSYALLKYVGCVG